MNFLNFLKQSTQSLNFNLSSIANSIGFTALTPQISAPKVSQPQKDSSKIDDKGFKFAEENMLAKETTKESPDDGQEGLVNGEKRVEAFTLQQQLINQYMHLNIQLLSRKLENLEQMEKVSKPEERSSVQVRSLKKKIKKVTNCGHPDREHYAKGMCNNCYHKFGRNKKPWNCPHDKLYANGMCQNCYINTYNRKRREDRAEEKGEDRCERDVNEGVKMEEEE